MFVDARCAVGAVAGAQRNLAEGEVLLEVVPFLCGRFAIFFAGPSISTPGDVVAVVLDDLLG